MLHSRCVKIPENVVFDKVGDEMVLLHLETGRYFGLNPVGSRMWELLVESGDSRMVQERMQQEFEVAGDVLGRDLEQLLVELTDRQLIVAGPAAVGI